MMATLMEKEYDYYGGDASDLGHVRRLHQRTFSSLVDQVFTVPTTLNVTRAQYDALPREGRQKAKRVPYVVPATFKTPTSRRLIENAVAINLLCLDVDDSVSAMPYVSSPETLAEQLMPFNFVAHTTASSTPAAPRLRILVQADGLPLEQYTAALEDLAQRIGLVHVNKESRVVVQPMYLPTMFRGEENHPLLISVSDGRPYATRDVAPTQAPKPSKPDATEPGLGSGSGLGSNIDDLDFLRPTLDEVTLRDVAAALKHLDPDCTYPEWLEIAAALRHQFPREPEASQAYALFDEWSSSGAKYVGAEDTKAKWSSLRPSPRGRVPVTIRTVLTRAAKGGWDADQVRKRCYQATLDWVKGLSADFPKNIDGTQYLHHALHRIAATPLISQSEEESLLRKVMKMAKALEMDAGMTSLRRDLRAIKAKVNADKARRERLPDWCKGLCYIAHTNLFFRPSTGESFSPEALDRAYGSKLLPTEAQLKEGGDDSISTKLRPIVRPQDYLLNMVQIPVAYDSLYDPQNPNDIFVHREGKVYVNTYTRNYPEPDPTMAVQAGELFTQHLAQLIEDPEHQRVLLDYLAHIVQRPGIKIRWAPLLQGAQGCGKTFLAEAMSVVLGPKHVTRVDPEALRGAWNDWAYGSQLVTLEEVRIAGQNRHEVMNHLKPLISNDYIGVNQRFRDSRTVENKTNYLLFTNHHDALALGHGDRRYFVIKSKIQTRQAVLELGPDYFVKLFGMLRDNAAGLRAYLETHDIAEDFPTAGPAPVTRFLEELVRDSASEITACVRDAIEDATNPLVQDDVLSSHILVQMLEVQGFKQIPHQRIAAVLRDEGYNRIGRATLADGTKHPLWSTNGHTLKQARIILDQRRAASVELL